ncbi:PQQ enzyme repeat protein [Micromonospora sp. MW-13]|uniref:outer membrane protein assembly factor BamB family protein n=1 Tax=Micromonospora sp. MW-13 TaxID=2094022 RepID=UPI000E450211|nr:PQQ-binding-like beta-propeller repeat protein [Micromonospora sp. MW-13]RGC70192.1 PQQ enzyme repeat protein [Micromonospora sp. MW-13]
MTVIDLGELRGAVEPEPPRPPRAVGRPLRVALAGAVALLTLAASAPVARPVSAVVPGGPGVEVFLIGDRMYVVEQVAAGSDGTREVAAYTTPAGPGGSLRPLWHTTAPGGTGPFQVREHGGFVLLTGGPDGRATETVVVDLATGRQRWRQPGFPAPTVDGGLLLLGGGDDETAGSVHVVDLASGRARWSAPATPGLMAERRRGAETDRVVLISGSGRTEVRDAGSGAVLVAREAGPAGRGYPSANVVGDLLLVTVEDSVDAGRVTAYGLDALDRRWELDLSAYVTWCGDLLCAAVRDVGVSALDPATGRTRWANPRWPWFVAAPGGRLLAAAPGSAAALEFAVLDAATGRTVAELGRWELVDNQAPDEPRFGVRQTREGGLLVAELDPARAVARRLDVLPDAAGECRSAGRGLVCRRPGGTYGWWRLPR